MKEYKVFVNKLELGVSLKISSEHLELNLVLSESDIRNIVANITNANWEHRQSIKAGTCINANVYWCCNDEGSFSILIGQDDETWEIGLKLPMYVINDLKNTFD